MNVASSLNDERARATAIDGGHGKPASSAPVPTGRSVAPEQWRNRSEAEDLVQETLLAGLEARVRFEARASERVWLVAILKHKLIDRSRRDRTRDRAHQALEEHVEACFDRRGVWRNVPRRWETPADPSPEQLELLRRCLRKLPAGTGDVLHLYERNEITAEALGRIVGLSESGVWSRLYRARTALRECFEKYGSGAEDGQ
jgi:RNA polymerase sigma-70 factor (ECF subfamily)